jgi:8-oxo-dGTP diphosphatase
MTDRQRVAAVIVRNGAVLMVRERGLDADGRHFGQEYWTLPGGGINQDESPESAVRREVLEEVGLRCRSIRYLFEFPYPSGITACFAVETEDADPLLGSDDLPCVCPRMVGIDWVPLPSVAPQTTGTAIPMMILAASLDDPPAAWALVGRPS